MRRELHFEEGPDGTDTAIYPIRIERHAAPVHVVGELLVNLREELGGAEAVATLWLPIGNGSASMRGDIWALVVNGAPELETEEASLGAELASGVAFLV